MKRAVFLDRDGVLNRAVLVDGAPKPPTSIAEVEILDGVCEAIQILKRNEFLPVVVTNQPDVARGLASKNQTNAINSFIGKCVSIEFFYTCFHDESDFCVCRKPLPGLIHLAAVDLNIDVTTSFLVGDRWRDIEAAQAAGCRSFFIDYSYPEKTPSLPFTRVLSLLQAVQIIVGGKYGA
jgi:D-glycero-D-manno-heptose 1,7-bisphosphate phosphatase